MSSQSKDNTCPTCEARGWEVAANGCSLILCTSCHGSGQQEDNTGHPTAETPDAQPLENVSGESFDPQKALALLREWAKEKFGAEPFNPTEPVVGGEILRFGFDQNPEEGEKYIYTKEMFEEDVKKRPWNYKPRWIYELQELIEADEL